MLNKKYRFHSRGGVRYVFQKGKTVRTQKMSLTTLDNERGFTRVAVVVSKKVLKTAVGRNRIRRRVYEAIRQNFEDLPEKRDYIFTVFTKDIADMPYKDLEKILGDLVAQSRISWYNYPNEYKKEGYCINYFNRRYHGYGPDWRFFSVDWFSRRPPNRQHSLPNL